MTWKLHKSHMLVLGEKKKCESVLSWLKIDTKKEESISGLLGLIRPQHIIFFESVNLIWLCYTLVILW